MKNPQWIAANLVKQIVTKLREVPEFEIAWLILKRTRGDALTAWRADIARMLAGALAGIDGDALAERDALLTLLDRIDYDGKSLPGELREDIGKALDAARKAGWRRA